MTFLIVSLIWIYGRNANGTNLNAFPLGGDPSNEREQAAWLDRNGLVPQILLDDKRYYLNKRNWEWLAREAASMNNRSMLYQGIRDTAGLHKYMRNVYPDLVYMNRTDTENEEDNPLPPIAEYDKYPEEEEQEHQEEIQLLPFIYGQSNGSRSRYRKSPVLPQSEDAIPLPISPNLRVPEDYDIEYTAGRPIKRDRARG